jgi:hypothetical protein
MEVEIFLHPQVPDLKGRARLKRGETAHPPRDTRGRHLISALIAGDSAGGAR